MHEYTSLHFYMDGSLRAAFDLEHLGGKITMLMTQGEQPDASNVPADRKKDVLYARMAIGETDLMGKDVPPERFQPTRSA